MTPELQEAYRARQRILDILTAIANLPFDVITCRNILKYFPDANIKKAMQNMREVLSRDGVLLLDIETERRIQEAGLDVRGFQKIGALIPSYVKV